MSLYVKRTRNLYDPHSPSPFKLSRSKIEFFIECPRCFYLDRRLGIGRPEGFPFTLNKAVDALLKKEFDIHRANGNPHPLMKKYKIDAIPFAHEDIEVWRNPFTGIQYLHEPTNFIIFGAIDDLWQDHKKKHLHIVDYKATSTRKEISLDQEYRSGYKRQMEIYQWLFRQNNFAVSNTGYFVYVNGQDDREAFDGKLEFNSEIISYIGNDSWISKTILAAKKCLDSLEIPEPSPTCAYCPYVAAVNKVTKNLS